jgi:exosortase K
MINKTAFWFVTTVVTAIAFKFLHLQSDTHDLLFFLTPAKIFVGWITQLKATASSSGFYFPSIGLTINKAFSAGNFFIIAFCLLSFTTPFHLFSRGRACIAFSIVLATAYLLTVFVTTLRIVGIVAFIKLDELLPWLMSAWALQLAKGVLYTAVLYLAYRMAKHTLVNRFKRFSYSDHYPTF